MVNFIELQEWARERLQEDRAVATTDASGETLESAVAAAAALLNVPLRQIEYEVTATGSSGFLGKGKREWQIRAYRKARVARNAREAAAALDEAGIAGPVVPDQDGEVIVHLGIDGGAYLKVTAPTGNGKPAVETKALQELQARRVANLKHENIVAAIKEARGEYVQVGEYNHDPVNDASMAVELDSTEMTASIIVTPPGAGGADQDYENYVSILKINRVVFGIKEDFLRHFVDHPVYREPVVVAEGSPPVDGRSAYFQFNFETDDSKIRLKEGADGRINFKELNIIQNVLAGQPLAKKVLAEEGTEGHTVTGKPLSAKDGKDVGFPLGRNVHVDEDGLTVVADINGQVLYVASKINVEPIYTVKGNVGLKTGNILFNGTVVVEGTVEDGYDIKATGNIEVSGTVEKANLEADGDIIVNQGINGKGAGLVRSKKSVWAKFIENARIEAGDKVVASDGIINSEVDALNRIICSGKKAHIVGGQLRAAEEINAKVIGSPTGGSITYCEVGFNPTLRAELTQRQEHRTSLTTQIEEVKLNIEGLMNIKKQRKSLPEDKEAVFQELVEKQRALDEEIKAESEEIARLEEELNSQKTRGRVSVSDQIYPGVKITIRDIKHDIRRQYKGVTFVLQRDLVEAVKYEEADKEAAQAPDGHTAA